MLVKTSDVKHSNFLGLIGTSPEPGITAQAMEAREPKKNKDLTNKQGDGSKFAARKSSSMPFWITQK